MIPQRDLSLLSNRLARKGGRRIPEAVLEKDYCLSWFLVGMSATPLKDILAFRLAGRWDSRDAGKKLKTTQAGRNDMIWGSIYFLTSQRPGSPSSVTVLPLVFRSNPKLSRNNRRLFHVLCICRRRVSQLFTMSP